MTNKGLLAATALAILVAPAFAEVKTKTIAYEHGETIFKGHPILITRFAILKMQFSARLQICRRRLAQKPCPSTLVTVTIKEVAMSHGTLVLAAVGVLAALIAMLGVARCHECSTQPGADARETVGQGSGQRHRHEALAHPQRHVHVGIAERRKGPRAL
jgi:hypothetical protein